MWVSCIFLSVLWANNVSILNYLQKNVWIFLPCFTKVDSHFCITLPGQSISGKCFDFQSSADNFHEFFKRLFQTNHFWMHFMGRSTFYRRPKIRSPVWETLDNFSKLSTMVKVAFSFRGYLSKSQFDIYFLRNLWSESRLCNLSVYSIGESYIDFKLSSENFGSCVMLFCILRLFIEDGFYWS